MDKKTFFFSGLVAAIISLSVVAVAGIVFYILFAKSNQTIIIQEPTVSENANIDFPDDTPTPTPEKLDIEVSDVNSISLRTNYEAFLDENTDCRKIYRELALLRKRKEGIPGCIGIYLQFNRDGTAFRHLKLDVDWEEFWTAKTTKEEFQNLAKSIIETKIFQAWDDRLMINTVNTTISITHSKGLRHLMSKVDLTSSAFLILMKNFRHSSSKLRPNWKLCHKKADCPQID